MTPAGRNMGAAGVLLLLIGVLTRYPEVVGCGLACLAAVGAAAGMAMTCRPRVVVSRHLEQSRITEGTPARVVLTFTNVGRRRSLPLIASGRFDSGEVEVGIPQPFAPHFTPGHLRPGDVPPWRVPGGPVRGCAL